MLVSHLRLENEHFEVMIMIGNDTIKGFWNCKRAKSATLTHLEAVNFDFYDFLPFMTPKMY